MINIKNTKTKYILIGTLASLIIYSIWYFYLNSITSQGRGGLGIIALAYPLVLPCQLLGLNKLGNAYLCTSFSIIIYSLLGSLIGFLVYKLKKK